MLLLVIQSLLIVTFASASLESLHLLNDAASSLRGAKRCNQVNDRPIVGILSQPYGNDTGTEYIAGSYVKYVEGAGARAVPVRFSANEKELRRIFDSVNGILFPGGAAELSSGHPFFDASSKIFNWAVQENQKGNYFPLWGTCLGFEQMMVIASGNNASVLSSSGKFDASNFPAPVKLTEDAAGSELISSMPIELVKAMATQDITFNSHEQGVAPEVFDGNRALSLFFTSLATYHDKKGRPFVAMVEARSNLPIYAVQFHPEKTIYEFYEPTLIPHQPNAINLSRWLASFFVSRARCNTNKFQGGFQQECKEVVQASSMRHIVNFNSYFSEIYTFSS